MSPATLGRRHAWFGRGAVAALSAASVLPLWAGAHASRHLGDDAYITLTYARSLASGQGFTYHGRDVLGTTTPLLAALVGSLGAAVPGASLDDLAVWVGALSWLATGWLLYLGRGAFALGSWPALALALVALLGGWTHALGMEAHLFALLLVLAAVLALSGRAASAGIVCGLLALARGEGVLFVPIAAVALLAWPAGPSGHRLDRRSAAWRLGRLGGGFLLVALAWAAFALPRFGSLIPGTLAAKAAQADSGLWQPFVSDLLGRWMPYWATTWGPERPAIANPIWWLVALGVAWMFARDRRLLVLPAWAAAYVAAYALIGAPSYPWYSLPVLFVVQLAAGLGAARLRDLPSRGRFGPAWSVLSAGALVALLAAATAARVEAVRDDRGDHRASSYLTLARWVRDNVPPDETIAFVEIGYLGYFAPNPIVDLAGLVTPDVVPDVARGDFAAGFYRHRPDVFVYLPDFDWALAAIRSDPRFDADYEAAATLPGPATSPFTVYRRRSASDAAEAVPAEP